MTYYEELGVEPDASVPQIRQAYKLLVRLLHPDGQTDPQLKALAECQMRRLGEIVGVLSNPRLRQEYDAGLRAAWTRPARRPGWMAWVRRYWFEIAISLVTLAFGAWWLATREADTISQAPASTPAEAVREPSQKPRPPAQARRPEPAAPYETIAPVLEEPSPPVSGPENDARFPVASTHSLPPEPATPLEPGNRSPFAGNWLYLPAPKEEVAPGQYPASYVELLLREEDGSLVGHYRSRHRIPDQAISPEVRFEVRGQPAEGSSATLPWTASTGAKGEVELTLGAANILKVNWWTTEFGGKNGLTSGTAVLVRQVAP